MIAEFLPGGRSVSGKSREQDPIHARLHPLRGALARVILLIVRQIYATEAALATSIDGLLRCLFCSDQKGGTDFVQIF